MYLVKYIIPTIGIATVIFGFYILSSITNSSDLKENVANLPVLDPVLDPVLEFISESEKEDINNLVEDSDNNIVLETHIIMIKEGEGEREEDIYDSLPIVRIASCFAISLYFGLSICYYVYYV